ncbi:hypothetical protein SAMN05877753_1227 [Bacillus oleivorans]|uniref:Uncharacterized protein n=1 Tax=Bacillus oleivorans TaxID=1448271 RepID=A0A285D9C3_9BACI|nr:hypothetical protein [Bacillus oleivorans]SNX75916.1 hypothetical protein SAMN05877753_1227 [Bacillus oleivorans]
MSCPTCKGIGRFYKQEAFGISVHPCLCSHSMAYRQALEHNREEIFKKIDEAYEQAFGKC